MTTYQTQPEMTAADYRNLANSQRSSAVESFDRCDTDGFLSQWAHNINSDLNNTKAEILENDGKSDFVGLYEGDRRVKAREITTKFGRSWLLHEDEVALIALRGKPFLPTGKTSRIHNQLGLQERKELAPAWCKITAHGTGLSGAASAFVHTYRSGCMWGSDATLIEA